MDIDYQTLSDGELNKLYAMANNELTRRQNMREVPGQVAGLVSTYEQYVGDRQEML